MSEENKLILDFPKETNMSKEKCREIMNIPAYAQFVRKNPGKKISNGNFIRIYTLLLCAVMTVLAVFDIFGDRTVWITLDAILITVSIITWVIQRKQIKKIRDGAIDSTLILDNEGVELKTEDGNDYKISWNNIFCLKEFKFSLAFIPKENTALIIVCDKEKSEEIYKYLAFNKIDLRMFTE